MLYDILLPYPYSVILDVVTTLIALIVIGILRLREKKKVESKLSKK